jgi:hypothetical protein
MTSRTFTPPYKQLVVIGRPYTVLERRRIRRRMKTNHETSKTPARSTPLEANGKAARHIHAHALLTEEVAPHCG